MPMPCARLSSSAAAFERQTLQPRGTPFISVLDAPSLPSIPSPCALPEQDMRRKKEMAGELRGLLDIQLDHKDESAAEQAAREAQEAAALRAQWQREQAAAEAAALQEKARQQAETAAIAEANRWAGWV